MWTASKWTAEAARGRLPRTSTTAAVTVMRRGGGLRDVDVEAASLPWDARREGGPCGAHSLPQHLLQKRETSLRSRVLGEATAALGAGDLRRARS